MHAFTDTAGRTWEVSLNVLLLKKVKEQTGRLLTGLADDDFALLVELHEDCALLVDVLWCLCEKQAPQHGVVDDDESQATEKFAEGLGGDALANAAAALVGAVTDFLPNQAQRATLKKLMEKVNQLGAKVGAVMLEKLDQIDPNSMDEGSIVSALSTPDIPDSHRGSLRTAS